MQQQILKKGKCSSPASREAKLQSMAQRQSWGFQEKIAHTHDFPGLAEQDQRFCRCANQNLQVPRLVTQDEQVIIRVGHLDDVMLLDERRERTGWLGQVE